MPYTKSIERKHETQKGGPGQKPKNLDELSGHLLRQLVTKAHDSVVGMVLLNHSTGRDHTNDYYPGLTDADMREVVRGLS